MTHIARGIARGERAILQTFGLRVVHEVEKEQIRVSRRANETTFGPSAAPSTVKVSAEMPTSPLSRKDRSLKIARCRAPVRGFRSMMFPLPKPLD